LAGFLALALLGAPAYADVTVRAEVEPLTIAEDGTVQFRILLEGEVSGDVAAPSLRGLEKWNVVNGPSISSQFRYVNGVSSTMRTWSWILAPLGAGRRTIPAVELEVDGQRLLTEPLTVTVEPSAGGRRGREPPGRRAGTGERVADDDVFIRAAVEPQDPFVGQPAILSYRLFTRREVTSVPQLQEVPSYPNFWTQEIESPSRITPRVERIDGREYQVYTIRQLALFGTASGETVVPAVTFSVPVRAQDRSPFRRPFFFSSVEPLYRRTLPVTIRVRPLPEEDQPEDFSGAVGRFALQAQVDRRNARAGEAVGLTVTVSGDGNLRSATAPSPEEVVDFTAYPAQEMEASPEVDDIFQQSRSWEYIFVPHVPGRQSLPAVEFSYFDPEDETYRTLTTPKIAVEVTGTPLADEGGPGGVQRREIRRLGQDIHFIKTTGWNPGGPSAPLYRSAWFWLLLAAPPAINAGALAFRWQSRRARARLAISRRRKAKRAASRRLRRAEGQAQAGDGRGFYREVAQALTDFVADKFSRSPTGLTYDRIAALLAQCSVPDGVSRSYLKVLEDCDCARFSPAARGSASRAELLARARRAIGDLESHL
jgi:hypothetical protein